MEKLYRNDIMSNELKLLNNWLINSGIQNNVDPDKGGFNAWYSLKNKSYPFIYSEITGYGITTLLFLNSLKENENYLNKAKAAADWIINQAMDESGGIYTRKFYESKNAEDHYSFDKGNIFTFDSGMVLFGMANLYENTKEEKYLEASKKIANFIIRLQKEDGKIFAFYNTKTDEKGDADDKWSNQSGAFHAKVAMGILKTFEITNNKKYKKAAINLCNSAFEFQQDDGRFITNTRDKTTLQHPHCYTAEGLLYCGLKLDNKTFIDSAVKAISWSIMSQNDNGGIPQIFNPKGGFIKHERTDILAQVLRLAIFMKKKLNTGFDLTSIDKLKDRLTSFINVKENTQKGGLFYGFESNGQKYEDLNSWCTMFAINAFNYYYTDEPSIEYLI
jgi:hypothetical protein|tara:strand:+ start:1632 stop:2798 length:1167 start_codon:yes stop_codon:yes gene_type:complete